MKLTLNKRPLEVTSTPGGFAVIERKWRKGDVIRVDLPMHLSVERLPHSDNYAAVLYGPIVLAGALGDAGLNKYDFWQISTTIPNKLVDERLIRRLLRQHPKNSSPILSQYTTDPHFSLDRCIGEARRGRAHTFLPQLLSSYAIYCAQ